MEKIKDINNDIAMPESPKSRLDRIFFNLFPAFWSTGAKVTYLAADYKEVHLKLPLTWRTRNYVGTIFGGSMFASTDALYFLLVLKNIGNDYIVWDKASSIRFKKPGKGTLHGKAIISHEELQYTDKIDRVYFLDLIDETGDICASIEKTIHIRNKKMIDNGI
jgi:acyl-coenzyme A thioesterase PaaI-like protein